MNPVRMAAIIFVALIGAVGAAFFARSFAAGKPHAHEVIASPKAVEAPQVRILVAKRDLQIGDRLTASDFGWQPWPVSSLNPAFITDGAPSATPASTTGIVAKTIEVQARTTLAGNAPGKSADLVGAIVREAILQNQPITMKQVVKGVDAGVLAVTLQPGMRAMAVPLTAESAAGGFILPGDHVDVVQSRKVDGPGGGRSAAGMVLRNVRVLAIDQQTRGGPKAASQLGATATLEVSPPQAEYLALSKSQGELSLILRSYADIAGPTTEGPGAKSREPLVAPPPVVRVFRNGSPSEVAVAR